MATKKATASKKKTSATKSATRGAAKKTEQRVAQPAAAVATANICAVEIDDAPVEKKSLKEKLVALRPGALVGEMLGTFVLAGAVIQLAQGGAAEKLGIALVLAVLVVIFGVVSGAHLNPAITIAQYVNRKIDGVKAIFYIVAQVLGAVLAFLILNAIFNAAYESSIVAALAKFGVTQEAIDTAGGLINWASSQGMTLDVVAQQVGIKSFIDMKLVAGAGLATFFAEITGAMVFGLGVGYAVFNKHKSAIQAGLAIGFGLFAGLMIGGGAVILNPAVAAAIGGFDWGGALFGTGAMTFWWPILIYVFGTTIGMTIGVTVYRFALKDVVARK